MGALVRWATAPGSPIGVVQEVDGPRVRVHFDGEDESKIFNARARVVERVELAGMVKRASTGAIGLLHAQTTVAPPRWQVILDGKLVTVAEADLRPHVLDDPRSRVIQRRLGSARQFSLAVTARRYEIEQLTTDLMSLGESRVDIKPHQVSVVHRVITNYPHRFLLCDEVGLGKTIEAGMILKELRARDGAGRCLVIAPPNLVRQWQFELKSKFNETFSIINRDTVKYLRATQGVEGNPFEVYNSVIVSSSWIAMPQWAKLAAETSWDMVIVDEAHHARVRISGNKREETRLYKVVRELTSPEAFSKRSTLFLTATPMQLDSRELYSLVEILDPALFPTVEHFERHRERLPGLNRLVHDLTEHGFPLPDRKPAWVIERVASWLDIDDTEAEQRLRAGAGSIAAVCDELAARHLLSEVLIRNRKKIVGGFMPRQAHRWEVDLSPEERHALDAVEWFVRDGFARADRANDQAVGFVMVVFQKLMASSIRALRTSLDRRRERLELLALSPSSATRRTPAIPELEEKLENDEYVSGLLDASSVAYVEEAAELRQLVEMLDAVPTDSKADTLVAQLQQLERHDPAVKVLLFTEFRETQEYLRGRLETIGWDVRLFHGQMKPDAKDAAVEGFRASSRPSILLSTEAGGEGRNFQFCHLLVNYDLPWNPMRVEQRIGRVDRIGQMNTVQVFNFWVRGTVEERVLNVLERRINVFEETVGGLDPILGDAERDLTKILQLGGEERERALHRFEEQIERKLQQARAAEEKLRDFIMETKSYSREIASQVTGVASSITPAGQELFVTRLLADVNTYLSRQEDGTFSIMFHEPFVSDYPQHCKDHLRRRTVAMRPDVKPDSEHIEYLGPGHPVVDDLIARATSPSYPGSAAAFEIESADEPSTAGWLAVYELGVPALHEVCELVPFFVHDSGEIDPELGRRLLDRAASLPNDRALPPSDLPSDEFEPALAAAETAGLERLRLLEMQAREDSDRQVERERAKLSAYFDYRIRAAQDRLASSRRVLVGLEATDDTERRRIIPVWRANVARDERLVEDLATARTAGLAQLAHRAASGGEQRLVAAARVEIVGSES
ncbi:MAG: DEAD/DEAH box helicase [Pseudonocardiaceae bacterium]